MNVKKNIKELQIDNIIIILPRVVLKKIGSLIAPYFLFKYLKFFKSSFNFFIKI